jgi:hypothetical protein
MAFITAALISGGAALLGGALASNAQGQAARTQADAANNAAALQKSTADKQLALQEKMFNTQNTLQEPFRKAGISGQNRLLDLLGLSGNTTAAGYGSAAQNFTPSDLTSDPGYQFRLSEGLKALDASAAARGGLNSGNAGRALVDYGQAAGSQEYQNAYNRYNTNRANILNPLQSLAGQGQSSSNAMGAAAGANAAAGSNTLQNYGNNAGNMMVNAGNAQASGYLGQANSWNSALNNAASGYQNSILMSKLFGSETGGYQPYNNYASNGVPMPYSRPSDL